MSSEDAVTCVQMWLEKNKPAALLEEQHRQLSLSDLGKPNYSAMAAPVLDVDGYFDADASRWKWPVSPRHFVNEDKNCGIHLVKNALGGKRKGLFQGIMTV